MIISFMGVDLGGCKGQIKSLTLLKKLFKMRAN
jgi:hypothetical protein